MPTYQDRCRECGKSFERKPSASTLSIASSPGFAILVPAGTRHNIINGPSGPMKLYTLYAPPNHRDGVVHATKAGRQRALRRGTTE